MALRRFALSGIRAGGNPFTRNFGCASPFDVVHSCHDPLVAEFVKLIFSKDGQEVVVKDGYDPVSAAIVAQELTKVGGKSPTE